MFLYVCFYCKCNSLKRLGENRTTTERNIIQKKLKEKQNNINTGFPAHEPPRKIDISKCLAGIFLLFLFFFMFSLEDSFYVFLFYMFLYVFFECKCKSLKRLGENRTTTERNIHKNIKTRRNT